MRGKSSIWKMAESEKRDGEIAVNDVIFETWLENQITPSENSIGKTKKKWRHESYLAFIEYLLCTGHCYRQCVYSFMQLQPVAKFLPLYCLYSFPIISLKPPEKFICLLTFNRKPFVMKYIYIAWETNQQRRGKKLNSSHTLSS